MNLPFVLSNHSILFDGTIDLLFFKTLLLRGRRSCTVGQASILCRRSLQYSWFRQPEKEFVNTAFLCHHRQSTTLRRKKFSMYSECSPFFTKHSNSTLFSFIFASNSRIYNVRYLLTSRSNPLSVACVESHFNRAPFLSDIQGWMHLQLYNTMSKSWLLL